MSRFRQSDPLWDNLLRMQIEFQVRQADEGGFTACAIGHSIFTEAETWEDLQVNVQQAASVHFDNPDVQTTLVLLAPLTVTLEP